MSDPARRPAVTGGVWSPARPRQVTRLAVAAVILSVLGPLVISAGLRTTLHEVRWFDPDSWREAETHGWALMVLGTLSCLGAVICGVAGLRRASTEPHRRGRRYAVVGIVLGLLLLLPMSALILITVMIFSVS